MNKWIDEATLTINKPINLKDLKQNEAYKNVLVALYNFRLLRLNWLNESIVLLDKLIGAVNEEINKI
jgi:hypothetical protein